MKSIDLLRKINLNLDLLSGSQEYKIKMHEKGVTTSFISEVIDLTKELGTQALADKDPTKDQEVQAARYIEFITNCHNETIDDIEAEGDKPSSKALVVCSWIGIAILVGLAAVLI